MEVANIAQMIKIYNKDDHSLLDMLQKASLIRRYLHCKNPGCGNLCVLRHRVSRIHLGYYFLCVPCNRLYPLTDGSVFQAFSINIRLILFIMWHWVCEVGSESVAQILGVKVKTVDRVYRRLRLRVCSWRVKKKPKNYLIGGMGHVVHVDEGVVKKQSYNDGRIVRHKFVVGMYDVTDRVGFLCFVREKSPSVIINEMKNRILPGTEVWTNDLRGYSVLDNLDGVSPYIHKTARTMKLFLNPHNNVRGNMATGYWVRFYHFVKKLNALGSPFLEEYADMYVWWERYGPTPGNRFKNMLTQIKSKYTFR